MEEKIVLSGVQATGSLHLGNYLGAISNWVKLQKQGKCYFFLADLHAITLPIDPKLLRQSILETAAAYLACGINPEQSAIFCQSSIPAHAELAWLFNCITPLGWLNRMTQFKDKAGKHRDQASLGLYAYPVLMVADILLYKPDLVPVGEDQKQHLELCRDVAGAFNRQFNCEYFKLPEPLIQGPATRVMSLRDGTAKMSKSDVSEYARINLKDDADTIAQKVRKAKSDMDLISLENLENRPELANFGNIIASINDTTIEKALEPFIGQGFGVLKQYLSDLLISHLDPITKEMNNYLSDPTELTKVLSAGAERANIIANKHLKEVKEIFGYLEI